MKNKLQQDRTKKSLPKSKQAPQTIANPGFTRIKLMLNVRRDWKGIIHVLPLGKTINSDFYRQQLMRLEQEVEKKRSESSNKKGVVFHHDNTRPHIFSHSANIKRIWSENVNASTI
ncbi:Histone-lysine N-methyltransferase SETMAR [Eumeta japonica]|uniref:Histone-lysine N-methyltransferase SETMAR n=1 Tax=Eumeta variegata TaxID=151549 RepID=A0A4C1W373_EUMVA|nr:Histone-lysine N-methyltransferase SETMAR [Eumeta japonica]